MTQKLLKIQILFLLSCSICFGQTADRWQQKAQYKMEIDMDVKTFQFTGKQHIVYTNNSPDTLDRVFYHLFFNAFQPGSMMDVRSRSIEDPDGRVKDRIFHLKENEIGYHKIDLLEMDGEECSFTMEGTVLEVDLPKSLLPGESTLLYMEFNSQVPKQVRRSGRDNKEGISLSMTQWYPKLSEYDYQGWHAHPYVGREFHGVWGDFDVSIRIAPNYIVAAGGVLKKMPKIRSNESGKKNRWQFRADNVHDFAWGADPDYQHLQHVADCGVEMNMYYQEGPLASEHWPKLGKIMDEAFTFANARYGKYPYPVYNFIQGGDGGMEYPMATLITGERSLGSLVGVSVHELMHSWYQMILGTNEALYPWMDEGFTSFASAEIMNHLRKKGLLEGEPQVNPMYNSTKSFARYTQSGYEEALSTHADHYTTNRAYGAGSYTKGSVFISQLEYVMGKEDFAKGLLRYFNTWKFKHPNPNDFIRSMEKASGMELDWYKEYMMNTTHTIDYAITDITEESGGTKINLSKVGAMPMPVDIEVVLKDGRKEYFTIPLRIMRGEKEFDYGVEMKVLPDWPWTNASYSVSLNQKLEDIESITLDPLGKIADVKLDDNVWPIKESKP